MPKTLSADQVTQLLRPSSGSQTNAQLPTQNGLPATLAPDQVKSLGGVVPEADPTSTPPDNPFQTPLTRIASGNASDNIEVAKGAIKQGVSDFSSVGAQNTPMGKALISDLASKGNTYALGVQALGKAVQPKNLPQAEGAAGTSLAEMALPGDGAVKTAGAAAEEAGVLPRSLMSSEALKTSANTDINKALGNSGKTSAAGLLAKDTNRLNGAETLYDLTKDQPVTRPDGSAFTFDPTKIENPQDLVSAFVQAKNQLWQKVQQGLSRGSSIQPDYTPVISQLKDVIENSASKSLVAHAQSRLDEIAQLNRQGVQGAQRYLQEELNPRIGAAVQGATDAPALKLDATIANGVNNALDHGLSQVKDASIRSYKDQYAALKSIEPDLVRMVQKTARQTGKGIPQYINDFGNLSLIEAAFAHNPALFVARGIGQKVLSRVLGTQRDPLDHLANAFKSIQAYKGAPQGLAETPTLALPPGVRGAPSQASNGYTIKLPAQSTTAADLAERSNTGIRQPINSLPEPIPPAPPLLLPAGKQWAIQGPTIRLPARIKDEPGVPLPPFQQ